MNLTDELRKLAELHQEGHLSAREFADAKRKLLAAGPAAAADPSPEETGAPPPEAEIEERHFKSSRWSSGNLFFPDRLTLAPDGMLFRKGALFGSSEQRIQYRSVASVQVTNGIFLSNLSIETSGGSQPIYINGLWKSDAKEIQATLRMWQRTET